MLGFPSTSLGHPVLWNEVDKVRVRMGKAAEAVLKQMKVAEVVISEGTEIPAAKKLPESTDSWGHPEIDEAVGKPPPSTDEGAEKVPPSKVPDERTLRRFPRTLAEALAESPKDFNESWFWLALAFILWYYIF